MHPDEIIRTEERFEESPIEINTENGALIEADIIQHTDVPINVLEPITKKYLKEVKQIREGKIKPLSTNDLWNE